jgi:pyruvate formate lyase activating enzyme
MRQGLYRFLPFSFVDAPETSAVVFCKGCDMRCPYCYNIDLLDESVTDADVSAEGIVERIQKLQYTNQNTGMKFNTVTYLVISGGEPTFSSCQDLEVFLKTAKELGLKTGIYTNGFNVDFVVKLIENGLLNFVHLDIKSIEQFNLDVVKQLYSKLSFLDFLQFNTTIYKTIHDETHLLKLKKYTAVAINNPISFCKEKFQSKFSYSLTPFYNNNDKIKTLGNLVSIENHYTDDEFNSLLGS